MKRFFRFTKRKKYTRQFAVLCLFLIALELFCPVLSDEPAAAAANQPNSSITSAEQFASEKSAGQSMTGANSHLQDNHQAVCHDECFCHATALPNASLPALTEPFVSRQTIAFNFTNPPTEFLPPPNLPPRLS